MATDLQERWALLRSTQGLSARAVQALSHRIETADDLSLFRMNPISFAQENKLAEREAVDVFLHATRAGLLEFSWGLLCPACGAFLTTPAALRSLANKYCSMCEVEVPPSDGSIEVAFTVAPRTRTIRYHEPEKLDLKSEWAHVFFSPSRQIQLSLRELFPKMLLDSVLIEPQRSTLRRTFSEPGRFALSAPMQHSLLHIEVRENATARSAEVDLIEGQFLPAQIEVAPGPVELHVNNRVGVRIPAAFALNVIPPKKDRTSTPQRIMQPYLTGKQLVTSQTFRELFRTESIPSESGLELKSLTVLFTDLKGSTELYEKVGDFRAYSLVRDHFNLLKRIIVSESGALVKTIGDAVMASFARPTQAVSAAAAMNREIRTVGSGSLELKIGMHTGPCIAVESNERLDYFGRTVNIAARAQSAADANQIVVTDSVYQSADVQTVIRDAKLSAREDRALFKGLDEEMKVFRLQ